MSLQMKSFENTLALRAFINPKDQELKASYQAVWNHTHESTLKNIRHHPQWYGTPIVTKLQELKEHAHFLQMELVSEVSKALTSKLQKWLIHEKLTANLAVKKLRYNDRALGVFSFARAAMGLQPAFQIAKQPALAQLESQTRLALGQSPWRTTVKTTHAFFSTRPQNRPLFRCYLLAGGHAARSGQELYYSGIGVAVLIAFLQRYQVATEVYVIHATKVGSQLLAASTKVKAATHELDVNQLLLLGSDPRFFRYQGFLTLIKIAEHFNITIPKSLGKFPSDLGTQLQAALPKKGYLFEPQYSLQAIVKNLANTLTNIHDYTSS